MKRQLKIGDWIRDDKSDWLHEIKNNNDIKFLTPLMDEYYEIVANFSGFNRAAIIIGLIIVLAALLREAMS